MHLDVYINEPSCISIEMNDALNFQIVVTMMFAVIVGAIYYQIDDTALSGIQNRLVHRNLLIQYYACTRDVIFPHVSLIVVK